MLLWDNSITETSVICMDCWHSSTVLWQTEVLYTIQHHSVSWGLVLGRVLEPGVCHHTCTEHHRNTAMQFPLLLHSDRLVLLTDIFQRVFAADAKYLENHEKTNQSFWESLVKCLATTDPPILNTEEKNNVSYQRNAYPYYTDTFILFCYTLGRENIQSHYLICWNTLKGVTGHLDKWGSGHCFLLHCSPYAKITGSV